MNNLLEKINTTPEQVSFEEVIQYIADHYDYTPTHFTNGTGNNQVTNEAGTNEGSCKIFAFAALENLTIEQTLHCFGDYYRKDVLTYPEGNDHANIRTFMMSGMAEIKFDQSALSRKN